MSELHEPPEEFEISGKEVSFNGEKKLMHRNPAFGPECFIVTDFYSLYNLQDMQ